MLECKYTVEFRGTFYASGAVAEGQVAHPCQQTRQNVKHVRMSCACKVTTMAQLGKSIFTSNSKVLRCKCHFRHTKVQ